jgi:hypothetical protein
LWMLLDANLEKYKMDLMAENNRTTDVDEDI